MLCEVLSPSAARIEGRTIPVQTGRGGIGFKRMEGDGITPVGRWTLDAVFFRPDRVPAPPCALPCYPITPWCGWCDAPAHRAYNQYIVHPFAASAERLWRDDGAYDLLIVTSYNRHPVIPGKGSAVFIHCSHDSRRPTAGCVAMERTVLSAFAATLRPGSALVVPESVNA